VVRAAVGSHKHQQHHVGGGSPTRRSSDGGGSGDNSTMIPTVKEGDLYTWNENINEDNVTSTPSTPQRRHSSTASSLTPLATQNLQQQTTLPRKQQHPTTAQKARAFYMGDYDVQPPAPPYSPDNASSHSKQSKRSRASNNATPLSWSWSEQFFFSQDDASVSLSENPTYNSASNPKIAVGGEGDVDQTSSFPSVGPVNSVKFEPIMEVSGGVGVGLNNDNGGADEDDDETCNNTIVEKVRQRSKKASRASTVGAFVTFLKALFGIGMLSNPAVLGEVGLLLGTFCHLLIVVGCAFACYLLLAARQLAKVEVMSKQQKEEETRNEYEMWRREMEDRAAMRAGRKIGSPFSSRNNNHSTVSASVPHVTESITSMSSSGTTAGMDQSRHTLRAANTGSITVDDTGSISVDEEWTVAPVSLTTVPLARVHASMIPPKQGWGRCEAAYQTAAGRNGPNNCNDADTSMDKYAATPSCGNVQLTRQSTKSGSRDSLNKKSPNKSPNSSGRSNSVTDEYQRFTDNVHKNYMPQSSPMPPVPPPKAAQVRLVTYGDVARYLAGKRASFFIIFTIVTVHLMFASGMVHIAVENLCYVVGWERLGWSYVEEYEEGRNLRTMMRGRRLGPSDDEDDHASRSSDEEEYYLEWKGPDFVGRLAMASLLFPIIQGLLQIPSLTELATISSVGLVTYAFGCIGSMLYTALVLTEGHPFMDHPDDMWTSKWSGIPTYVATTIYCIEGINLALPTVSSIEGTQRWGGGGLMRSQTQKNSGSGGATKKDNEGQDLSVFIVVGAVFLYGMVTLVVSWIGLAGGLGGGIGTTHGEDGCWDVTYCLNSSAVRFVYMLSLGVALVLTLPVILYPSTEMLEVWLDERNDERRRKSEAAAAAAMMSHQPGVGVPSRPFWSSQKSLLPDDDETVYTVKDSFSPRQMGIKHLDIEMRELSSSTTGAGDYVAPSCSPEPSPMTLQNNDNDSLMNTPNTSGPENTKLKAKRKLKYWKLRMFLAFIICVIGTIEGSFPSVLKAAEVIRGVGLSIAGLIFPPLLYMSAVGGNFSVPMAAAMALLIGLGFFNIVLVLLSAFGSRDFIVEEGRGNFYEM